MDWVANDQRQNALLRVFYMFIFMTLLIVRANPSASFPPGVMPPLGAVPPVGNPRSSTAPSHLYPAALRLLRVAEAVLRRLGGITCEIYEFLKQADARAMSLRKRIGEAAQLQVRPSERLDTS